MPRDRRVVDSGLQRKGFVRTERDHHYFTYHTLGGKKTSVFTKTSHGEREISDVNLSKMAKQVRLTRDDFFKLIDCSLARDEYEGRLISGKHIPPPTPSPNNTPKNKGG